MEFETLLEIVGAEPLFETGLLLAGAVDPGDVRRQLSRWTAAGKLIQLRRGLYTLASPYRKVTPHPFLVANRLVLGSYVSLQAALAYHGLIPEYTPLVTSVTTGRPAVYEETPLGRYSFQHIQPALFYGHQWQAVGHGQYAYIAAPEKALLDLIYLTPGGETLGYLRELRLQAWERLDLTRLQAWAERAASPKLRRAATHLHQLTAEESDYETLPDPPA